MDIGKTLGKIRSEKRMKQLWAAKKLGITDVTLSRYENGWRKMPIELAQRYAELLGHTLTLIRNE